MLSSLREVVHPHKSWTLAACDVALTPLQYVLGNRKVIFEQTGFWVKSKKVKSVVQIFFAFLTTLFFAPIIVSALIIKATSIEHRWLVQSYEIWKIKHFFLANHFRLLHITQGEKQSFVFTIENPVTLKIQSAHCSWDGSLHYKKLYVG